MRIDEYGRHPQDKKYRDTDPSVPVVLSYPSRSDHSKRSGNEDHLNRVVVLTHNYITFDVTKMVQFLPQYKSALFAPNP